MLQFMDLTRTRHSSGRTHQEGKKTVKRNDLSISTAVSALIASLLLVGVAFAQHPSPTPVSSPGTSVGGFEVTSSIELGVRGLEVNGNHEKYRSDLNYRAGFRVFDSSFLIEDKTIGGVKLFDTAQVITSGFGSDPSGVFRFNLDKTGLYKFESNIRRVKYFNFLNNHAAPEPVIGRPRGQHNFNTVHNFGDFDLTIFPERQSLRFRLGASFNDTKGPATYTTRFQGDEFEVQSNVDTESMDFRAGVDGKVLGFNLGVTYGHRRFTDNTSYFQEPSLGNSSAPNTASIDSFRRDYPIKGTTNFVHFNAQRTFAEKLDFTGRFIYSLSNTEFGLNEIYTGRGQNGVFIDLDQFNIFGDAKRPQSRGDIGATYRVTDRFRISDTFTFDQFNISGGNELLEVIIRRTVAGLPNSPAPTNTLYHRVTAYRRFSNLLDVDYQVNNRLGFNVGWRYTDRNVELGGFQQNLNTSVVSGTIDDEHKNHTHTFLAGGKGKPLKNWVIFADVEIGDSDNVFTRLANNEFINFRVRSRASFNRFAFNVSGIWKDNDSPGRAGAGNVVAFESTVESKNRIFSASVDWTPRDEFSLSGGYTYQHLTSKVDVLVPIAGTPGNYRRGLSEYFVRDSHFFFDVTARPIRRVSIFASYRINDDNGQGDRVAARPEDIISSYPIRFQSPEVRVAIRLTKNIDWNVGYQYYDYKERQTQSGFIGFDQNYNAHLPYTSLRIYFGRSAADR